VRCGSAQALWVVASCGPGALGDQAHAVESHDDGGAFVAGDAQGIPHVAVGRSIDGADRQAIEQPIHIQRPGDIRGKLRRHMTGGGHVRLDR